MWKGILRTIKTLPALAGALLILFYDIGPATGPADSASHFARWAAWLGYPDVLEFLPEFLKEKAADNYVLSAALVVLTIYVFLVWALPWWRGRHPRWISLKEATERASAYGEKHGMLGLANLGIFSDPQDYFSQAFVSDGSVRFRGKRAPAFKRKTIPQSTLKHASADPFASRLVSNTPREHFWYEGVEVRSRDVRHYLRKFSHKND